MAGHGIKDTFERGPYGEIMPPPMLAGAMPGETLHEMVGPEIFEQMKPEEREAFYGEAAVYLHQKNLLRLFAGEFPGGMPEAAALYQAVMQGEPISLRPLGWEGATYHTFAPILQRIAGDEWRVGLAGQGHCIALAGSPASVLRRARQLYVIWAENELQQ